MNIEKYLNKRIIFNCSYKIRSDINNLVITNNDSAYVNSLDLINKKNFTTGFTWLIHPYMACILNYFDGKKPLNEVIKEISLDSNLSELNVIESINKILYNKEQIFYPVPNIDIDLPLPKNLLVECKPNEVRDNILKGIDINYISKHMDFSTIRLNIPNECTIMPNSNCYTNCIYCYVDKVTAYNPLSISKIKEIITEARSLNMRDCQINGGDIFCYPHWFELLCHLKDNQYLPYLSTKYPLTEDSISKLASLKVTKIQLSIDSTNEKVLTKMLYVDSKYFEKMKKMIDLLHKYNISFCVKSVLTKYNDSLDNVKNLIKTITSFDHLTDMSLAPGEYSVYNNNFVSFRSSKKQLDIIHQYVDELNNPKVGMQDYMEPTLNMSLEEKKVDFSKRAACSANTTSFLILPDGKVTYCEQTYWNPNFIMGDLTKQSIMEMWNSEHVKQMWHFSQESLQDGNPCKTCVEFEKCRHGKGVCYRLAYTAYGFKYWNYPPPQCPKAPKVTSDIYIK